MNIRHCTTLGMKKMKGVDIKQKCKPLKDAAQYLINNINPYATEDKTDDNKNKQINDVIPNPKIEKKVISMTETDVAEL